LKAKKSILPQIAAATFLFAITLAATTLLVRAVNWSVDTQFTLDPAFDRDPSITEIRNMQTGERILWLVWDSDKFGQFDLYYTTSVDNGLTWAPYRMLTYDPATDQMPSIMQARDGRLWVVWASNRIGNQYDLYYKTSFDYGFSWSNDTRLTADPGDDWAPSITQDLEGRIWVVWQRDVSGNYTIFYMTSSDNGLTWSNPTNLTDTNLRWELRPSITSTRNGTLWVVWASYRTGNFDIFYKTSSDYGLTWSDETPLTTDSNWDHTPSVLQAPDETMFVFWASDRPPGGDYDLYYTNSSADWSSWSPATQLTDDPNDDQSPSVTNTKERKIWMVWESTRTENFDIFYKTSDVILGHDLAINEMVATPELGPRGQPINISVTVQNLGNFTEVFNVVVYADRNTRDVHVDIGNQTVLLDAGNITIVQFTWDTTDVPYGTYWITAEVVLQEDYDSTDNIAQAKVGGITVAFNNPKANMLISVFSLASVAVVMIPLALLAMVFFKLLMSIRLPCRQLKSNATHPVISGVTTKKSKSLQRKT
jgi:hypothetical protein